MSAPSGARAVGISDGADDRCTLAGLRTQCWQRPREGLRVLQTAESTSTYVASVKLQRPRKRKKKNKINNNNGVSAQHSLTLTSSARAHAASLPPFGFDSVVRHTRATLLSRKWSCDVESSSRLATEISRVTSCANGLCSGDSGRGRCSY